MLSEAEESDNANMESDGRHSPSPGRRGKSCTEAMRCPNVANSRRKGSIKAVLSQYNAHEWPTERRMRWEKPGRQR
jgi:hypothetical protein